MLILQTQLMRQPKTSNKEKKTIKKKNETETELDSYIAESQRPGSSRSGQLLSEVRASWQRTKAGPKRQLTGRRTDGGSDGWTDG